MFNSRLYLTGSLSTFSWLGKIHRKERYVFDIGIWYALQIIKYIRKVIIIKNNIKRIQPRFWPEFGQMGKVRLIENVIAIECQNETACWPFEKYIVNIINWNIVMIYYDNNSSLIGLLQFYYALVQWCKRTKWHISIMCALF